MLTPSPSSQARFAAGGSGRFLNSINWIEWGNSQELIPASGKTVKDSRQVGAYTITNTCTISQPPTGTGFGDSRTGISVYIPGGYSKDAFDDLYNIGGTGRANTMTAALSNVTSGAFVRFKVDCSSRVFGPGLPAGGRAVPLDGLAFADAESSNRLARIGAVHAEADPATDWYLLDRHRNSGCTQHTMAILEPHDGKERVRLEPSGLACPSGPTAVGFMKVAPVNGLTSGIFGFQGDGTSAAAVGVVQHIDFGDAPASYGEALALYQPAWTGQPLQNGTTNAFTTTLTDLGNPPIVLGRRITPDPRGNTAPDDGDDGFSQATARIATPGGTATETITCSGSGQVRGWVDWNANGTFDPQEGSNTVACRGGTATLSWSVPTDAVSSSTNPNGTYLRLRAAQSAAELTSPTGFTATGEVEDHPYVIRLAELRVEKSSDALVGRKFVNDLVTYTVEATNKGPDAFANDYRAHVFDDLTGVLDDATFVATSLNTTINGASAPNQAVFDQQTKQISWHGPLPIGGTVRITYQVRLKVGGDRRVGNVAWGQHGGPDVPVTGVQCNPRSASGWNSSPAVPCAREDYRIISLIKLVQSRYDDHADTSGSWNLTATGDFGGEADDTTRTVPGGTLSNHRNSFVAPATGEFTFTEANRPGRGIGYTLQSMTWDEAAGLATFINEDQPASLTWTKTSAGSGELLAGSVWSLTGRNLNNLEVSDCVAADAAACTGRDRDPAAGSFRVEGLLWGNYTLVERTAPAGHQLDDAPRQIAVTATAVAQPASLGAIPNERLLGTVQWRKTDATTGLDLGRAEFRLTGPGGAVLDVADCVAADATSCTGLDHDPQGGRFTVTGLAWGQWQLVESQAPLGYVLGTRQEVFSIEASALTHQVATPFQNTRTVLPVLPLTGGTAADLYLLGGGAFIALAVGLITFRRFRANRQVSHTMEGTQ
ncbi:MAG: CshA/CshB family fibrillar adhesin-related protein [Propionibacteriaceae bacterium]|nr:CshA/CshB family fibrillar adhesin-related protein [Propionibacteriaceae bacterium]